MGNPAQDRDTGEPIPLFDHADVLHGYADLAGQGRAFYLQMSAARGQPPAN
jgi:hypothetical protein